MRPNDDMLDIAALAKEELDPELQPYLTTTQFGPALLHPLVYQVIGIIPGLANRMLHQKQDAIARAEKAGDWAHIIWMHERPYRTPALIEYVVGEDEYGVPLSLAKCEPWQRELAASVWRDSENLEEYEEEWDCMLDGPGLLMCDDPEGFEALPDEVIIYRGDCPDGGWSWSLDIDIARWFAQRLLKQGERPYPVLSGRVKKSDITGYLMDRGESEILVREGLVEMGEGAS